MLSFEEMVLPEGRTVESIVRDCHEAIVQIGAAKRPFAMVRFNGERHIDPHPEVREAWEKRSAEVVFSAQ